MRRQKLPAELSDASIAALPNRAEEIEALPEPTPPAAPEPGTPLPRETRHTRRRVCYAREYERTIPGDPGIVPEEASPLIGLNLHFRRTRARYTSCPLETWCRSYRQEIVYPSYNNAGRTAGRT